MLNTFYKFIKHNCNENTRKTCLVTSSTISKWDSFDNVNPEFKWSYSAIAANKFIQREPGGDSKQKKVEAARITLFY